MKRIMGWVLAAGLAFGLGGAAGAAPAGAGLAPVRTAAQEQTGALAVKAGWQGRRHGHYRALRHRHVHYRPVHYRHLRHYRPVYYRPVRYRPVHVAPVWGYGAYRRHYRPRCVIRHQTVWSAYGWIQRPVRVCRW